MKIPVLMFLFLLSNFASAYAIAAVTVTVDNEQFHFAHTPRLVEVLAPIANAQNWYWPSAALFKADNSQLEEERQLLLNNLSILSKNYQSDNPKLAETLERLKATITSWRLAQRLKVKVDYDLARSMPASNPQFSDGNYILELTERKKSVQLFGAVQMPIKVTHQGHADVSNYISDKDRSSLANKDYVIIIQADGRAISAPVAYWNEKHQEVMPGSQIFVPFDESVFQPEFSLINKQMITLALNRLQ